MSRLFLYICLLLLFVTCFRNVFAHSFTKSVYGENVKWRDDVSQVFFKVETLNSRNISSGEIVEVVQKAFDEWNQYSHIKLYIDSRGTTSTSNRIYFFSQASWKNLGSGVVGLTEVVYENDYSQIIGASIILNDLNHSLSTEEQSGYFIGDVITHELGHVFGVNHSEVHNSTMFWSLRQGQNTLASDDIYAIKTLYENTSGKGEIKGKVVGGKDLVGVFGAHVELLSSDNGRIETSIITDQDGNFSLKNLDLNKGYYIYILPVLQLGALSDYYKSVKSDFCFQRSTYRGSFFQSCLNKNRGTAQRLTLTATNKIIDIGNVSVSCSVKTNGNYVVSKNVDGYDFVFSSGEKNKSLIGFFTNYEISNTVPDVINVDLRQFTHQGNHFLNVIIAMQSFFSPLNVKVEVKNNNGDIVYASADMPLDSDGNRILDINTDIALSDIASDNYFTITILPSPEDFSYNDYNDPATFLDKTYQYLLITNIKDSSGKIIESSGQYNKKISDNSSCPDAEQTYSVAPYISTKGGPLPSSSLNISENMSNSEVGSGCGSIRKISNNTNRSGQNSIQNALSFLITFFIGIIISGQFVLKFYRANEKI